MMSGYQERRENGIIAQNEFSRMVEQRGFICLENGYDFSSENRKKTKRILNLPAARSFRFRPDFFVCDQTKSFYVEVKNSTCIESDSLQALENLNHINSVYLAVKYENKWYFERFNRNLFSQYPVNAPPNDLDDDEIFCHSKSGSGKLYFRIFIENMTPIEKSILYE